jgi:hypothetical protein
MTKKKVAEKPCQVLGAGRRFVTTFGIVEVIEDSRAAPTADLPPNLPELLKRWNSARLKREQQSTKSYTTRAVQSLTQRCLLHDLYEQNELTQANVFAVYFGKKDPRMARPKERQRAFASADPLEPDPSLPVESYPDRIVVCKLIPDQRTRICQDENGVEQTVHYASIGTDSLKETRLYLRRRFLKEEYNEELDVYVCRLCASRFLSQTGYRYHVRSEVCKRMKKIAFETVDGRRATIERRAEHVLQRHKVAAHNSSHEEPLKKIQFIAEQLNPTRPNRGSLTSAKKARQDPSMYPQVLLALGFKLLPREEKRVTLSAFRRYAPVSNAPENNVATRQPMTLTRYEQEQQTLQGKVAHVVARNKETEEARQNRINPVSPYTVLLRLRWQLRFEQSRFLGPVYPSVFKALKFKKPMSAYQENKMKKKEEKKKRKVVSRKPKDAPQKPLPPLVDVRVLVEECDSGRYPSMKRVGSDTKRGRKCAFCKRRNPNQVMHSCTYCPQVFHWSCARTRFTMKDPEPGDVTMCPKCIGLVQSRRLRAEKRRIERNNAEGPSLTGVDEKEAALDAMALTKSVIPGREYECVAAQGRQIKELTELLRDTQLRLSNSLEVGRINSVRRSMIASSESEALF